MMNEELRTAPGLTAEIRGHIGQLINSVTDNWLLVAPKSNPAMLEVFADRDSLPYRDMMPWAGEFAGKYLTAAVQTWILSHNEALGELIGEFVETLVGFQDEDGYLGPWPSDSRLTNVSPYHKDNDFIAWDTWGHYHIMLGLIFWFECTNNQTALQSACRIADLICSKYLGKKSPALVETGWSETNLSPIHSLARLYRITSTPRYLQMALQIAEEFEQTAEGKPLAGDYMRMALAGKDFFEMPKPRWESLHPIMGLAELYWCTGEVKYREAFERIWWSIANNDRHNNGGFSQGEQATGNPYDPAAIETCCTIAWIALSVEMLKLTGNPVVIDELELSTVNSVIGMHSATGRWVTYNTPSDGIRRSCLDHVVFQVRAGSPELTCCSVNGPRGLGIISDWALMWNGRAIHVNYYGPGVITALLDDGTRIELRQDTDYPLSGKIRLEIEVSRTIEMPLRFRVPSWSPRTTFAVNSKIVDGANPGSYFEIDRTWTSGDEVEINLDMGLRFWPGERECSGLTSIYRGPVLLAFDSRYNRHLATVNDAIPYGAKKWEMSAEYAAIPTLDAKNMGLEVFDWKGWLAPNLLFKVTASNGEEIFLCDFGSAGETGTPYRSWLPVEGLEHPTKSVHRSPFYGARAT